MVPPRCRSCVRNNLRPCVTLRPTCASVGQRWPVYRPHELQMSNKLNKSNRAMNIFTQVEAEGISKLKAIKDWRVSYLASIALTGTGTADIKINNASHQHLLEFSSSIPRIRRSLLSKFNLIIERPTEIAGEQTIHCSICNKALNFNLPVWYHLIKYNVNHFACFVCFDINSPSHPSTKCYRRD